jgi:AraC-like DNA-binding protein
MAYSKYWEQSAGDDRASVIQGWCFSEDESHPPPIRVLPDGEVSILFSAPASGETWEATLLGATTRASIVIQDEPRVQIQARLAPGAGSSVFGMDFRDFRDAAVPLADVWGRPRANMLLEALSSADSWPNRRSAIEVVFAHAGGAIAPAAELVRRARAAIRRGRGRLRIDAVCETLGTHPRQLERAFAHHLGISPKLLSRIVRFRCAREALRDGEPAAQVALATGYSDQAHMTREFRAFAGVPPSLLVSAVGFVQADAEDPA